MDLDLFQFASSYIYDLSRNIMIITTFGWGGGASFRFWCGEVRFPP
jgi:hypothetical protein